MFRCFDILHDAAIEASDIRYDSDKKVLYIVAERDVLNNEKLIVEKNLIIAKKYSHPIVRTELWLEGVISFNLKTKDPSLKHHTFNECKEGDNPGEYELIFCEVLHISIRLSNEPTGNLTDVAGEPRKGTFWQLIFPFPATFARTG
jgi:hypothetical protein